MGDGNFKGGYAEIQDDVEEQKLIMLNLPFFSPAKQNSEEQNNFFFIR